MLVLLGDKLQSLLGGKLEGTSVEEAVLKLKDTIQNMIEQGELQP